MESLKNFLFKKKFSIFLKADSKAIYLASLFFIFFLVFDFFFLDNRFTVFVNYLKENQNYVLSIFCSFYFLASLYFTFLFLLITISSTWSYRSIYLSFFFVCLVAEYSYQSALGRTISFLDFPVILGTTNDQKLDSFLEFFNWFALIPFGVLIITCFLFKPVQKRFKGKVFVGFTLASVFFYFHLSYINQSIIDYRLPNSSFSAFSQTLADYVQYGIISGIEDFHRESVKRAVATDFHPTNNIVLIVDESMRGDHLSLNGYNRKTTPFLEKLRDENILKNYGIASAISTSSHPSYTGIIIGLTTEMFTEPFKNGRPFKDGSLKTLPTIFQYAKAMNYKTHFFDGQMMVFWGPMPKDVNFIDNLQTLKEINNTNQAEALKQWEIDPKIAQSVKEIISNSTGNFIFIYKRGVHFPYERNYPKDATRWSPIFRFNEQLQKPPTEAKESVINSYDNAILYNLDNFFKNLVDDYSAIPNNTSIIYTSDHGQCFEGGGRAPHGGKTPEEANVPLFIINNNVNQFDTEYKASHENIFPTILDLIKYPQELRTPKYALSLLKAKKEDSKLRSFLPDLKEKVPFIETE